MSPPILLFISANQSATQKMNLHLASVKRLTMQAFMTPYHSPLTNPTRGEAISATNLRNMHSA